MGHVDPGEQALGRLIGQSPAMQLALTRISRIATIDAAVVIEGETGTGKELAARAIHYRGARRDFPFVPINCGALPDSLIENELFGHERGSFTGAAGGHPGILRIAHRGTLFLDEVDALTPHAQVVLLRFLQDKTFRAIGAVREEEADVRVIAASNTPLEDLVRRNVFRSDLYYRLKILSVGLPPLREREGDPELLARHFIFKCARHYGMEEKSLHPDTLRWLRAYSWPGNVRELENCIQQEFLLSDGQCVIAHPDGRGVRPARAAAPPAAADDTLPPYARARLHALEEFNRTYLTRLLATARGNVSEAARIAGKERRALGKLIKRYQIQRTACRR